MPRAPNFGFLEKDASAKNKRYFFSICASCTGHPLDQKLGGSGLKYNHLHPGEKSVYPRHFEISMESLISYYHLLWNCLMVSATTQPKILFVKGIPGGSWGLNFLLRLFISDSLSPPFAFLCGMSISLLEGRCHSYGNVKAIKYYNQNIGESVFNT